MENATRDYGRYTDGELVARIIAGDTGALIHLLTVRCGGRFKHLCAANNSARMDVEDLAQEVALLLVKDDHKALRAFRATATDSGRNCTLVTYVTVCASRLIHKRGKSLGHEIDWATAFGHPPGEDPEVEDTRNEKTILRMKVLDAIMALAKPEERLVLLEYSIRGRPVAEVARMLDRESLGKGTVANVYTICTRAKKSLRLILEEGGSYARLPN